MSSCTAILFALIYAVFFIALLRILIVRMERFEKKQTEELRKEV